MSAPTPSPPLRELSPQPGVMRLPFASLRRFSVFLAMLGVFAASGGAAAASEGGGPTFVITPDQGELVSEMIAADVGSLGGCRLEQAGIDRSVIRGTWLCDGEPVRLTIEHPSVAIDPLRVTGELAIVAGDPPPPPALVDALATRLGQYAGRWHWTTVEPGIGGEASDSSLRHHPSPWPLLWIPLLPLALWALGRALRRLDVRDRWGLAAVSVAALVPRALYEHLPLNWRADYAGPTDAVSVARVRMVRGYGELFAWLDRLVPIRSATIFAVDVVASTVFVVLVTATLLRFARREGGISPVVAWLFGALAATDFGLVCLGASSALQNVAAMAFAVGLAWFGEAVLHREGGGRARLAAAFLAMSAYACLLVGLTRPELGIYAALFPAILAFRREVWRRRETLVFLAVAAVAAGAAVAFWASEGLGATVVSPSLRTVRTVLDNALRVNPLGYHPLVVGALGLAALAGAVFRARRWLPLFVGYFVVVLPRAASDFYGDRIAAHLVHLRYDILVLPLVLLWMAVGGAMVWEILRERRLLGARRGVWASLLIVAVLVGPRLLSASTPGVWRQSDQQQAEVETQGAGLTGRLFPRTLLSVRAEYAFLRDNLAKIPPGGSILEVWTYGVVKDDARGESSVVPPDLDLGLAPAFPLLLFDRRDIRWVALLPTRPLPEPTESAGEYYYRGPFCDVDPDRHLGGESAEGFREKYGIDRGEVDAFLRRARDDCQREASRVTSWVAEWEGHVLTIGHARLGGDRLRLGLGRLGAEGGR